MDTLAPLLAKRVNAYLNGNWSQGGVGAWFALTTQIQNNPYTKYQSSQSQLSTIVGEGGGAIPARLAELDIWSGLRVVVRRERWFPRLGHDDRRYATRRRYRRLRSRRQKADDEAHTHATAAISVPLPPPNSRSSKPQRPPAAHPPIQLASIRRPLYSTKTAQSGTIKTAGLGHRWNGAQQGARRPAGLGGPNGQRHRKSITFGVLPHRLEDGGLSSDEDSAAPAPTVFSVR